MKSARVVVLAFLLHPSALTSLALSLTKPNRETPPSDHREQHGEDTSLLSRRGWLWKAPLGAVGTYAYGRLLYNALSVSGFEYPVAHEERVASTLTAALTATAAAASRSNNNYSSTTRTASTTTPLRVLEVGIGTEARLIRRGLYDAAIHQLAKAGGGRGVELTGLDLRPPNAKVEREAQAKLRQLGEQEGVDIRLETVRGSITSSQELPFADGHFDAVVCCLTLCSVDDPVVAVGEIQRLLRPDGGTLGYVEHVAVNDGGDYEEENSRHGFLAWQQTVLDPLQQRLADNCHLHRSTQNTIGSVFGVERGTARVLQHERFYVDAMWPVSCQSCGVVQRTV